MPRPRSLSFASVCTLLFTTLACIGAVDAFLSGGKGDWSRQWCGPTVPRRYGETSCATSLQISTKKQEKLADFIEEELITKSPGEKLLEELLALIAECREPGFAMLDSFGSGDGGGQSDETRNWSKEGGGAVGASEEVQIEEGELGEMKAAAAGKTEAREESSGSGRALRDILERLINLSDRKEGEDDGLAASLADIERRCHKWGALHTETDARLLREEEEEDLPRRHVIKLMLENKKRLKKGKVSRSSVLEADREVSQVMASWERWSASMIEAKRAGVLDVVLERRLKRLGGGSGVSGAVQRSDSASVSRVVDRAFRPPSVREVADLSERFPSTLPSPGLEGGLEVSPERRRSFRHALIERLIDAWNQSGRGKRVAPTIPVLHLSDIPPIEGGMEGPRERVCRGQTISSGLMGALNKDGSAKVARETRSLSGGLRGLSVLLLDAQGDPASLEATARAAVTRLKRREKAPALERLVREATEGDSSGRPRKVQVAAVTVSQVVRLPPEVVAVRDGRGNFCRGLGLEGALSRGITALLVRPRLQALVVPSASADSEPEKMVSRQESEKNEGEGGEEEESLPDLEVLSVRMGVVPKRVPEVLEDMMEEAEETVRGMRELREELEEKGEKGEGVEDTEGNRLVEGESASAGGEVSDSGTSEREEKTREQTSELSADEESSLGGVGLEENGEFERSAEIFSSLRSTLEAVVSISLRKAFSSHLVASRLKKRLGSLSVVLREHAEKEKAEVKRPTEVIDDPNYVRRSIFKNRFCLPDDFRSKPMIDITQTGYHQVMPATSKAEVRRLREKWLRVQEEKQKALEELRKGNSSPEIRKAAFREFSPPNSLLLPRSKRRLMRGVPGTRGVNAQGFLDDRVRRKEANKLENRKTVPVERWTKFPPEMMRVSGGTRGPSAEEKMRVLEEIFQIGDGEEDGEYDDEMDGYGDGVESSGLPRQLLEKLERWGLRNPSGREGGGERLHLYDEGGGHDSLGVIEMIKSGALSAGVRGIPLSTDESEREKLFSQKTKKWIWPKASGREFIGWGYSNYARERGRTSLRHRPPASREEAEAFSSTPPGAIRDTPADGVVVGRPPRSPVGTVKTAPKDRYAEVQSLLAEVTPSLLDRPMAVEEMKLRNPKLTSELLGEPPLDRSTVFEQERRLMIRMEADLEYGPQDSGFDSSFSAFDDDALARDRNFIQSLQKGGPNGVPLVAPGAERGGKSLLLFKPVSTRFGTAFLADPRAETVTPFLSSPQQQKEKEDPQKFISDYWSSVTGILSDDEDEDEDLPAKGVGAGGRFAGAKVRGQLKHQWEWDKPGKLKKSKRSQGHTLRSQPHRKGVSSDQMTKGQRKKMHEAQKRERKKIRNKYRAVARGYD
uniref:Uncharacterized protein n=1 Tax=Chromera velia CCMP2878 TaxID=1169474 RepID=A0A0G4HVS6_9ALVE|eukprot:Cvel_1422.t1-p1 / transcript=Cvel_1422.t1 / gene=Cvel_1422 / organism=Chromera_velia_CCMP2878 / gene_product=hypothetical protein / transcript_product=hypothetical protein / location=Cvel_scaffold49:139172-145375(+) / protein_length=1366 / sequence_SO=supercontig / SO=protein_coding / is_pseudo=false